MRPRAAANVLRLASAFFFGLSLGVGGLVTYYESERKEQAETRRRQQNDAVTKTTTAQVQISREAKDRIGEKSNAADDDALLPTPSEVVARHGQYVSSFDKRLRNPAWACIKLEKRSSDSNNDDEKADRSLSKFRPDPNVPEPFRTKPDDFKASGYDRGHLVAASDVTSQHDMDETFLMSNISPQVGVGMNRGFWLLLEKFVRRLTLSYEDVFVCSGPLFLAEFDQTSQTWMVKYNVIGPAHDIAVPTHFFKCIHARTGVNSSKTCFVVPNRQIDHTREPLSKFESTIDEVERFSGLQLFARTKSDDASGSLCDEVKCDLLKEQVFSKSSRRTLG